jgi:hypothetical protein
MMVKIPIFFSEVFQSFKAAAQTNEGRSSRANNKKERTATRESFEVFGWEIDRITDLLIEEQDLANDQGSDALTTTSRILWAGIDADTSERVKACLARRALKRELRDPDLPAEVGRR